MPATKVGKIQSARYRRASNGSLIKPHQQSNRDRCSDYIVDAKGDKTLSEDLESIKDVKSNQEYLIKYAFNKHKCYDIETDTLLRSTNCSSIKNAKSEFLADEMAYYSVKIESGNSQNINKAFHIINSFKGHTVPAAKVHAIGEEFARRLAGDNFKYVVSTHTNTDHFHNHIVINAYAADGPYKFIDDWNLGLKLQRISNELSLENGVEIISERADKGTYELDENKLTFTKIRDKKMADNGSAKSKLMSDIILTAKNSSNWEEYKTQMIKKGYRLNQNIKSVTYICKGIGAIRDNRLGFQFTRAYIENFFNEKNELDNIKSIKLRINTNNLYTPKYVGTGKNSVRIPAILRLISYLIKIFKEILNADTIKYQKKDKSNVISVKNIEKQLNNLENIEKMIKNYEINNFSSLKIRKNQILREYTLLNNRHKDFSTTIRKLKSIEKAIYDYKDIKDTIKNLGIEEKDLKLYDFTNDDILINKAKLNPIKPKTKSRLYQALHNSGFVLKYQYNQLTEDEAKDICYFLAAKKDHKGDIPIPNSLYTLSEYLYLKKNNKLPKTEKTPLENRFLTLDYKELINKYPVLKKNEERSVKNAYQTEIKLYRDAILKLRSYGLNTEAQIDDFKENTINVIISNYKNASERLNEYKKELQNLNKIESFYDGSYENIYKPIKMLSEHDIIEKEINSLIKSNESTTEELLCLQSTLRDLDLSILDDESVIIAPIDILTVAKLALFIQGKDLEIDDLLKLDKSEIKQIILDFIKNDEYNLDKLIEGQLDMEKQSEKYNIYQNKIEIIDNSNTKPKIHANIEQKESKDENYYKDD